MPYPIHFLTVDGQALPEPSAYTVRRFDIDDGAAVRSETGKLRRNRVRAAVYVISAEWRVSTSALQAITAALAPDAVTAAFFDPTSGTTQTCLMRAGECAATCIGYDNGENYWAFETTLEAY